MNKSPLFPPVWSLRLSILAAILSLSAFRQLLSYHLEVFFSVQGHCGKWSVLVDLRMLSSGASLRREKKYLGTELSFPSDNTNPSTMSFSFCPDVSAAV